MRHLLAIFILLVTLFCNTESKGQILARHHDCSDIYTNYTPYYSEFYQATNSPPPYSLDLNGDSIADFMFYRYSFYGGTYSDRYSYILPLGQNEVAFALSDTVMYTCNCPIPPNATNTILDIPKVFSNGDTIDKHLIWKNNQLYFDDWHRYINSYRYLKGGGVQFNGDTVTIGLRLITAANDTLYGWIGLRFVSASYFQIYDMACDASPMAPPLITQNGSILSSNFSSGNQWYRNDTLLVGETAQTYTPTQTKAWTLSAP